MIEMTAIERIDIKARESDNTNVRVEAVEIIQIVAMGVGVKWDDGAWVPTWGTAWMFLKKVDGVDYNTVFAFITTSDVTGLSTALAWKSDVWHTHAISDVTGLTSALSWKEGTITAGTISQYWRWDKSFQTLDTSVVPENGNLYHTESRVRASLLTWLSITGWSISSSDSIIQAFWKLQNQINWLLGWAIYQWTWNASTNSPSITWWSGTKGHYYVVSVAWSTNIDGVTDWKVWDWIIYNGTAWQKVDNTDAVAMVNGYIGNVVLTTADIAESGNLYFTDERGQDAIGSILANSARITLTYSDGTPSITADLVAWSVTDTYLWTGINANKIWGWAVSNTEFSYLDGVTSGIQSQIDGKVTNARTLTINWVGYDLSADRSWTITAWWTPAWSTSYIQYNTGGAFDAKSTFVFVEDLDALGLQVAIPKAAAHFASITGATIADVTVSSTSLSDSVSVSAPNGTATLIAEPTAWSGWSGSLSESGGNPNFYANGTVYTARVYPCLYVASTGSYYRSQFYEQIQFTDPNDSAYYQYLNFNWWTVSISGETVYYFVEIDVNSGGYNAIGTYSWTSLQIESISGSNSTTAWPSEYTNAGWTGPSTPSGLSGYAWWLYWSGFQDNNGSTPFTANSRQWQIEVDSWKDISGTKYVSWTPTTNSFTDDGSFNSYRVASAWSSGGTQDGFIYRRQYSDDGGMSWSGWIYRYHDGSFDGTYYYSYDEDFSNDSDAEWRWWQTFSWGWSITKSFDAYGRGVSPSGNYYYSSGFNTYTANIPSDSVRYIIKHTFTSMPANGAKILAPTGSVSYWYVTTTDFYDVGYTTWWYGTVVTPTTYGFTGTNQNREYFFYGYSATLDIYSVNADLSSTTLISGEKYVTGSFTYPSGVTRVRIYKRINWTGGYYYKDFTSPTNSFTDDALDNSWSSAWTYPPTNTSVTPWTLRLDRQITSLSNLQLQLAVVGTGTGTRYAGIAFWAATDSTTDASFQTYLYHESNTGYLHASTGAFRVVSSVWATYNAQIWASGTIFNNLSSSSNHFQVKGLSNQYNIMQRSDIDTVCFGSLYSGSDPQSAVFIQPFAGADLAIVLSGHASHSGTSPLLRIQTSAGSFNGSITTWGHFLSNVGSLSNPWQSFHTDADTGFYGVSANIMGAVTGGAERARWSSLWYDVKAGWSSWQARVWWCLTQFYTDAWNTTTSETDIYSYSVPASTLDTNGHKIRAEYAGTCVNSSSTKQIKVKFDGTTIFDSGASAVSASAHWYITVLGVRVSSTVIRFTVTFIGTGIAITSQTTYTSVTVTNFTSARILKLTGTAAWVWAATNDIVAREGIVEFIPNI